MVEIISKKDGPRREDVQIRKILNENRATITQLADCISGGTYSASKKPKPQPQPSGSIIHILGTTSARESEPYVRISINNRVVIADRNGNKQLHHIGEIRERNSHRYFVVATRENGFFSPVDQEIADKILEIDGILLDGENVEERLSRELELRLEINQA